MSKYYTPEISQFHVGFEYEYMPRTWNWILDASGKDWIKESFSASCGQDGECELHEIEKSIEENKLRVKYLDREDIESLGWVLKQQGLPNEEYFGWEKFQKNDYGLFLAENGYVGIDKGHNIITGEESKVLFQGTIKNKSELKMVLKMIRV